MVANNINTARFQPGQIIRGETFNSLRRSMGSPLARAREMAEHAEATFTNGADTYQSLVAPSLGDEAPKRYSDPSTRTTIIVGIYVVACIVAGGLVTLLALCMR